MKVFKRSVAVILSVLMLISAFAVAADAADTSKYNAGGGSETEGDFEYEYSGENAFITNYSGSASELTIPAKFGLYNVKSIRQSAFSGNSTLTKITFEDSCNLQEIENQAFYGCSELVEIQLPDTVTTLGDKVFKNCSKLEKANIPSGVANVSADLFTNCAKLGSIIIPDGISAINGGAFYGCSALESVVIPSSVDNIYANAFEDCTALKTVYYKSSYADWHYNVTVAMGNAPLNSATMVYNYSGLDFNFVDNGLGTVEFTGYNGSDDTVTIPAAFEGYNVTELSAGFMKGNTTVKKVVISEGVKSIDDEAFMNCSSLEEIVLPKSLETIGENAFENCTSITKVYYRSGSTDWNTISIGSGNGEIVPYEKRVYYYSGLEFNYKVVDAISGEAVITGYNGSETAITIPGTLNGYTVTGIDESFIVCSPAVKSVTVSSGIRTIHGYAFSDSTALETVVLPEGLNDIFGFAFSCCTALKSINIPSTVTVISKNAFYECSSLESIEVPAGVSSIGSDTFYSCTSLKDVILNSGLTSIGTDAFVNCGLSELTIPPTVTAIADYSVGYNYDGVNYTKVTGFTVKGYKDSFAETYAVNNGFKFVDVTPDPDFTTTVISSGKVRIEKYNHTDTADLVIPETFGGDEVVEIAADAFEDHTEVKTVSIPKTVTKIEDGAFVPLTGVTSYSVDSDNTNYKSVDGNVYSKDGNILFAYACGKTDTEFTIPEGVVTVGKKAFCNCAALKTVTTASTVETIKYGAFMGCNNVTDFKLCEGLTTLEMFAFFDCDNLTTITIPKSVNSIEGEALGYYYDSVEGIDKIYGTFTLKVYDGTFAVAYANANGINYEIIDETETSAPDTTSSEDTEATETTTGGSDISYNYDDGDGLLTVTGSGAVPDYMAAEIPWHDKGLETKVKKVVVSDGVTEIGNEAFMKFSELEEVVIPDSVKRIGDYAFNECKKLKKVDFGNGVQIIGTGAFLDTAMTEAKLPASAVEFKFLAIGFHTVSPGTSDNVEGFKIIGPVGSKAQEYAEENGFIFESDGTSVTEATTDAAETTESTDSAEATTAASEETTAVDSTAQPDTASASEETASVPAKKCTFTYLPSAEQIKNGNSFVLAIQDKNANLHSYAMEKSAIKLDGVSVYSVSVDMDYEPVTVMYQVYAGDVWVSQITKSASNIDSIIGEIITSDGSVYGSKTVPAKTSKKANTIKVTAKTKTVKAAKLKKSKVIVKPLKIKSAKGTVKVVKVKKGTDSKIYKKITVNAKNGAITLKRGKYAKKSYKIILKVTAKGNSKYSSKIISKIIKIKIK